MPEKIKPIIDAVVPLPPESLRKIQELAEFSLFEKGEMISRLGQPNQLEYFVIDGVCKSYLLSPDGEEITLSFFMSNSILSPFTTRSQNGVSIINLRALTRMEIATIDAFAFENLMVDDLAVRHFGNTVLRNELMNKVQKEIGFASLTAQKRLQNMRALYPNLENLVPHTDIASYLGITNVSLSRLRSQS